MTNVQYRRLAARMTIAAMVAITVSLAGLPWAIPFGSPANAAELAVACPTDDLQQALNDANPGDTILIAGTCTGSYRIPDGSVLTIRGNPADGADGFDGTDAPRRSLSGHDVEVTIKDLFFRNSHSPTDGGALSLTGTIAATLDGLQFENNEAAGSGGAAHLTSIFGSTSTDTATPIVVQSSVFAMNTMTDTTAGTGGGLHVTADRQSIEVRSSTFTGNVAASNGGGGFLSSADGAVTFASNTVGTNRAGAHGGGVAATGDGIAFDDNQVTGNRADARAGPVISGGGGGAFLTSGTAVAVEVRRNTFSGNSTAVDGGGATIRLAAGSTANLVDNLFSENTLTADTRCENTHFGGGLFLQALLPSGMTETATQSGNVFAQNVIEPASSIVGTCSEPADEAAPNAVGDAGGGGEYVSSIDVTSVDDQFVRNSIENSVGEVGDGEAEGGGLAIVGAGAAFTGRNLVSAGNVVGGPAGNGGGIYVGAVATAIELRLLNATVSGNRVISPSVGPGIGGGAADRLVMANTIVAGNNGAATSGGSTPDITGFGGGVTASFSDACQGPGFTGGPYPGTGNICANPALVNPTEGDVHETAASPTRDAGSNAAITGTITTDYEGDPRVADSNGDGTAVVDMGADELVLRADLVTTKSASETTVKAGTNVAYAVAATDNGPDAAANVRITDPLPAGATFVSASPSAGGTCTTPAAGAGGTVTCTWAGSTASAAVRSVSIVVNLSTAGTLANTATSSSDMADPSPGNNAATATVTVTGSGGASGTGGTPGDGVTPPGSIGIGDGYCMLAEDGGLFTFGGCTFFGAAATGPIIAPQSRRILNAPMVGFAMTPSDLGYWMAGADGGIFTFGDAPFLGSMGGTPLNSPIVGLASTPTGKGYYLVAADGGIFTFGDAKFWGSMGGSKLNQPIVNIVVTPSGNGYWMVASDGGIFTFGDARFFGSTGGMKLNQPIIGMAARPGGLGYWLVATDGGIFSFGNAPFLGSMGATPLNMPIVAMKSTSTGGGYYLVANDGGIFTFGDAAFAGSMGGTKLNQPIVDLTG